jgi:hypothetical protein
MSVWLLLITTACYIGAALAEARNGHYPMALVFTGYTIANFGLIAAL